jgi:hypothetical protein
MSLLALKHNLLEAIVFLIINFMRKIDLAVWVTPAIDSTICVIFVSRQSGLLISVLL